MALVAQGIAADLDRRLPAQFAERGKEKNVLRRTVHLRGPLDDGQRERLLQIANACPVHRILTGEVEVPTSLG